MFRVKHSYRWLALGLVLALLVLLVSGIEATYAKLVGGVQARRTSNEAVELKLAVDSGGLVRVVIGTNQITFPVKANQELDTGQLRISGDVVQVFENDQLVCQIPVKDIPTAYKRFCYDERPPVVRLSRSPSPNANGWNNRAVTVTITAEDEEDGSGIKAIYYKIGTRSPVEVGTGQLTLSQGGRVATYSLTITDEGTQNLGFWAVDQAGNESEHQALTVRIDKTRPSISVSLSRTSIYRGDSIRVTVSASDSLSGIDSVTASDSNLGSISLSRSGDRWQGTINPSRSGRVTATAYDKAGNSNSDSTSYSVEARPAYFEITDLSVSPSSPQVGQRVTIRATIKNTGEESATKTVTLYIDGSRKDSKSLTLRAGRSETVSFSYTFSYSRTYTVKVSTPDDSKSTTVRVKAKPAYFEVTSLSVPSSANVGESVTIRATIKNTGGTRDTQDIDLYIDGSWEDSERITLDPGESETVRFYYTFHSSGSHTVKVASDDDYASRTVRVTRPSQPPEITWVDAPYSVTGELYGDTELIFYIPVEIHFEDPDGDIIQLNKVVYHSSGVFIGEASKDPGIRGWTSGSFSDETVITTPNDVTFCQGAFIIEFTLVDAAGNYSNTYTIEVPIAGCVG